MRLCTKFAGSLQLYVANYYSSLQVDSSRVCSIVCGALEMDIGRFVCAVAFGETMKNQGYFRVFFLISFNLEIV